MRYYYEKPESWDRRGWKVCMCNHPLFNRGTLYLSEDGRGLIIVQKHFNEATKAMWWGQVDAWIASDIYHASGFPEYFDRMARKVNREGLYPVVPVRKIMWALKLKPLRKEIWEEEFT